jgi:sodium-dependent dicarboxylate transporter 2/3/5
MDIQAILGVLIVAAAMIFFVFEKIPIAITAVGASLLMWAIGAIDVKDVYAPFGSQVTIFVAAMMIVGSALFNTGAIDIVVGWFQKSGVEKRPRLLIAAITLVTAFLSAFLSNSAVIAIFLPLIAVLAARSTRKMNVQLLVLSAGIGAAIGGLATLAGSASQVVTQGILIETEGATPMGLFTLTAVGAPLVAITVLYMSTIGYNIGSKVLTSPIPSTFSAMGEGKPSDATAPAGAQGKKGVNWRMPFSAATLVVIIVAFAMGADIAIVAMIGAVIMVLTRCLPLPDAIKSIDWNTIIILSAAQAFGGGLTKSGGGQLIADWVSSTLGNAAGPWLVLLILNIVAMVLTNFASNTALTAMFVPISMSIATALGQNPTSWAVIITIACSIAIFTPVGTPCMTQTMVAGMKYTDYVKIGLPLAIILTIAAVFIGMVVYP